MMLAALRFILAALPAIFFVQRPAVPFRYLIGYGLTVGVGQFGCLFYAMHIGMPAGAASVVLQSQAFFTLVFTAILLTLAGAVCWGVSNIIVRKASVFAKSQKIKLDMFSLVVSSSIVPAFGRDNYFIGLIHSYVDG